MGSMKCGEYLDWLSYCWLLKKDGASWSCCAVILAVSVAKRNARILGMCDFVSGFVQVQHL